MTSKFFKNVLSFPFRKLQISLVKMTINDNINRHTNVKEGNFKRSHHSQRQQMTSEERLISFFQG